MTSGVKLLPWRNQNFQGLSRRSPKLCLLTCLSWIIFTVCFACLTTDAYAQEVPADSVPQDELATLEDEYVEEASEPDEMALIELEIPIVVTASRREQKLSTVPFAMSIITANDIRVSGARTIPDALRLAPGVDVADLSFGNAAVSPRGFHGFLASQVLVLVDGRQIFDSLFGGTLWGSWPFQLEDIARIEVIRGPGGVTWGANAVNGVINIITKQPKDQQGWTITSRAGTRGEAKQHIGYGFTEANLSLRISVEYDGSDGFRKGGSIMRKLDDGHQGGKIGVHGVYKKDADSIWTFSAGSAVVDGLFPPSPGAGFFNRRNSGSQASFLLANLSHRIDDQRSYEMTGYINDFFASPGVPSIDYRYQQIGFLFSYLDKKSDTRTQTYGLDTRVELFDSTNADPFMLTRSRVNAVQTGIYLQEEYLLNPKWSLTLGGRIDYDSYNGFQPSARASLTYQLSEDSVLYSSVSRAFYMGTTAGSFLNVPLLNGLARVTNAENTDPTTLIAYEVGYRGILADKFQTSLNFFWHDYDEVATLRPELGGRALLSIEYNNRSGNVALYGVEFETKWPATPKLDLVANYTYQQLNWGVDEPFTQRDFISPPKHKVTLGARYKANDKLSLSAHMYYVDAVNSPDPVNPFGVLHIDPYIRLDLRAEQQLWDEYSFFSVGVRNLLDKDHLEGTTAFLNSAEVPRTYFAEFRMAIK